MQAMSLCVYVCMCQRGVVSVQATSPCVYVGVCQRGVVSVQATSLCVCRCVSARCRQCASDISAWPPVIHSSSSFSRLFVGSLFANGLRRQRSSQELLDLQPSKYRWSWKTGKFVKN